MTFSDEGLEPAVLNGEDELAFILRDHGDRDSQRYWIGGSTNTGEDGTVEYPEDYIPSGSGNHQAAKVVYIIMA